MIDPERLRDQRRQNVLQSVLLLGSMALLLGWLGFCLAGGAGLVWLTLIGLGAVIFGRRVSSRMVLRMYGARPIHPAEAPALFDILHELSRRAGLERPPSLWYLPTRAMNAFALGTRRDAAIALSAGLLQQLDRREIRGVIAHELGHVLSDDVRIMGWADTVSRVTHFLSTAGTVLLVFGTFSLLLGGPGPPWGIVLAMMLAPHLTNLLQLKLSRTREFNADLEAAELTHDPVGLARALKKLEVYSQGFWERILMPGRRVPEPSILRTHPPIEERIARLLSYQREQGLRPPMRGERRVPVSLPPGFVELPRGPRYRVSGLWF